MANPVKESNALRQLKSVVADLTQVEVARRLKVTQQAVSSWLAGRTIPDAMNRKKLSVLLGVQEDGWLDETERRELKKFASMRAKAG